MRRKNKQFSLYLKEVERRYKKSKIKGYNFLKSQKINKLWKRGKKLSTTKRNRHKKKALKSRNQGIEKYTKLTELLSQIKTHRNKINLGGINESSLNSSRNLNGSKKHLRYESRSNKKKKLKKLKYTKRFENSPNLYLKHSMSSGNFNKMSAFEKPLLK